MIKYQEPLNQHTTFRIGGKADIFAEPQSEEELRQVLLDAKAKKLSVTFLGNGSNVLVLDGGIRGVVVSLRGLNSLQVNGCTMIAGAGVGIALAVTTACQKSLSGLEFAYGIPGSIGGATYMNAGAFGGEMSQVVKAIGVMDLDGNKRTLIADEMGFGYRASALQNYPGVITSVIMELQPGNGELIGQTIGERLAKRKATQPWEYPSAGSVFKHQGDFIPAKVIDEMGLKGLKVGGAEVSTKHAGFIINKNNATAADVLQLVEQIKAQVKAKHGVDLEMEIEVLGERA